MTAMMEFLSNKAGIEVWASCQADFGRSLVYNACTHRRTCTPPPPTTHDTLLNLSTNSTPNQKRPLFRDLLNFWTAARFIEGGWRCCGPETLGANNLPDLLNPPSIVAPPPYIDYQLAAVVMNRVLKPLQKRILATLENLVLAGRARNWFHIFLSIFVLLRGYELVFAHDIAWTCKREYPVSCLPAVT